ncbi:hypothetical protein LZP69_00010 [Shewanella sp. AS1]|uniref:hypothetical protein n=1 Tax=Shewanella sp. AS1 TaxID=2907626 RepID=UPI001F23F634|nr:hypothetical protein [Shewanella sp. AS1]MCE9677577.1 hypothetical protein [Shewanella sp. AS1]
MELFDVVTAIAALLGLAVLASVFYHARHLILLVIGIALINKYTIYAFVIVLILSTAMCLYDPFSKGRRVNIRLVDAVLEGLQVTFGIIVAAWFVGMILSG